MKKYNRRNFFKFLGKGAAIVGASGLFGLPEVEKLEAKKEWKFNVPKYDKDADILNFAECHNVSSVKFPAGFPEDSYPVQFESGYVMDWKDSIRLEPNYFCGKLVSFSFMPSDEVIFVDDNEHNQETS